MYFVYIILLFPLVCFSQENEESVSRIILDSALLSKSTRYAVLSDKYKSEGNYGEAARFIQKSIDLSFEFLDSLKKSDYWLDSIASSGQIKLIGEGYYAKATCRFLLKDFHGAVEDFSLSIQYMSKTSDHYGKAFYNRGLAYYNVGNIQRCCQDLKKAYELGIYEAAAGIRDTCN